VGIGNSESGIGNWQHWDWQHFHIGNIQRGCLRLRRRRLGATLGWGRMGGGLMVDSGNNMDYARTTSSRSRANRCAHPFRCRGRVRPRRPGLSKVVEVVSNLTNVLLLKRCAQGNQIRPQRNFRILEEKPKRTLAKFGILSPETR